MRDFPWLVGLKRTQGRSDVRNEELNMFWYEEKIKRYETTCFVYITSSKVNKIVDSLNQFRLQSGNVLLLNLYHGMLEC